MTAEIVAQQVVGGLALGFIYALIALGFTMMLRATELVNFAQGELVMAGAYIGFTLLTVTPLPYVAVFVITAALTGVLGAAIELVTLRIIRHNCAPLLNLIIATVGIGICLRILAQMIWGAAPLRYPDGATGSEHTLIAGLPFSSQHLLIIGLAAIAMFALHVFFQRTLIGTAWRAAASDSSTAELMGIGFDRIVTLTFGISSALAGAAGVLVAPLFLVGQDLWLEGPKAFAAAALGQFQILGTMVGGPVLGVMEAVAAGHISSSYKNAIAYGATIIVLMLVAIPRMPAGGGTPPKHTRITFREALGIGREQQGAANVSTATIIFLVALLTPLFIDDYTANVFSLLLIYGVAALGLQLVIGFSGAIIVGFAAFLGIGAYASAIASIKFGLPFPLPLLFGAICAGSTGLIFGPMLRLPTHYCAIATLGFGEICHILFVNLKAVTNGMSGISGIPKPRIFNFEIVSDQRFYYLALAVLVLVYLALRRLVKSRYGRALVASRENELAALAMGVNVRWYRTLAFAVGAACAGISGSLFAYFYSYISPDSFTLVQSIAFLTMVVIGGLGSLGGAVAGAGIVVCIPEFLRVAAEYRVLFYGMLIVIFMMFLPGGLAELTPRTCGVLVAGLKRAADFFVARSRMPALSVEDVQVRFGGVVALAGVSIEMEAGKVYGLIGPNGSGKTTLCNAISGFSELFGGRITRQGEELPRHQPHMIMRCGISRTFQDIQVFGEMSALENVMLGLHSHAKAGLFAGIARWPWVGREERVIRERSMAALEYAGMAQLAEQPANRLSFGQQRMVELARALVSEPAVVLLDEPAAGLSPPMVDRLTSIIHELKSGGKISVLLIEHVIRLVMGISDQIIVLESGKKISEGAPDLVRRDPRVIEAYLGKAMDDAENP